MDDKTIKKGNGLVTAGFVLGIVAIATSFIPIINNASIIMGILAAVFGIIGVSKKTHAKSKAITAIILGVLSVVIALALQAQWSNDIDEVSENLNEISDEMDKASGDQTEELLKNDVTVDFGEFEAVEGEFTTETKLAVTVTNKHAEQKSYSVEIEAVDANGSRLDDDTVYINDLGSGQSQTVNAFEYVTSDKIEQLKTATFKVLKISQY